jgi:serine/threonine protein kinase
MEFGQLSNRWADVGTLPGRAGWVTVPVGWAGLGWQEWSAVGRCRWATRSPSHAGVGGSGWVHARNMPLIRTRVARGGGSTADASVLRRPAARPGRLVWNHGGEVGPLTELLVGHDIAGYHLLELAGEGGMGRVYRARQNRLERIVALKVIRPEIATDELFRERLQREARLAASIDHPCVVPVYEADEVEGVLFVAMRWIAGPDLRRMLLAEGPLEPGRAAHIVGQAAAGLGAAHNVGLVHRDIKPANILLEGDRVYVADFGISHPVSGPDEATIAGGFFGTVDYAAPELLRGVPVDTRADIYALGCVLYEMLTGAVPFPADSLADKVSAHLTSEPPRPSALRPELPRALDRVVKRALEKDAGSRYTTPGEFASATERAVRASRRWSQVRAESRRLLRRIVVGIACAAVVAILATIAVAAWPSGTARPPTRPPGTQTDSPAAEAVSAARGVAPIVSQLLSEAGVTNGGKVPSGSLRPCKSALTGVPRTCRSRWGGVEEIGNRGTRLHLRTMSVKLTGVTTASTIHNPTTGVSATAPSGTRFVVIDLIVTNITNKFRVFESNGATGRMTALLLSDARGNTDPIAGPHAQVYSPEYGPAEAALARPLAGATLVSHGEPYSGQLVFHYPVTELRDLARGVLFVRELDESWGTSGSFGVIRLGQ